ncbi:hypothetical protein DID88_002913 [Monilinia fructigena]|uniref:Amino acid permease/ SLC12A domain-containing protein n=1 Tax=Monilinia fructigena TaxID=38457 RepID=A0A395INI9_9HELO|nr:hypothetical protein DID88_002913 [Monilinia fructigena]
MGAKEKISRMPQLRQEMMLNWKLLATNQTYTLIENFSTSFAALYFVGGVRVTYTTGIASGGPLAYWTSYIVTCFFTFITAAVIAEVCSASPSAGSIYLWAAEAGGPKYGRLLGFVVAWWSTTAWMTFCASNTQGAVNYMLSEIVVFNVDFPTDTSDIKFRAVQWICTEVLLALAAIVNFLPPRLFKYVFWVSSFLVMLDFVLNLIWLPIGAARTIGFRTAEEAFMTTYNGTGAPAGWNWCLSYLATAGWVSRVSAEGQPRNAVLVIWGCASLVTCTILPSAVAFTSLISAAGVPSAAAYGLISFGRFFLTPNTFPQPRWSLGKLSRPFHFISIFWNGWVVAILFSPYEFPVTGATLNYAPIIMAGVTILALISWWFTPVGSWLPRERISHFVESEGAPAEGLRQEADDQVQTPEPEGDTTPATISENGELLDRATAR